MQIPEGWRGEKAEKRGEELNTFPTLYAREKMCVEPNPDVDQSQIFFPLRVEFRQTASDDIHRSVGGVNATKKKREKGKKLTGFIVSLCHLKVWVKNHETRCLFALLGTSCFQKKSLNLKKDEDWTQRKI